MFCQRALAKISRTLQSSKARSGRCFLQNVLSSLRKLHISHYSTAGGISVHKLKSRGLVELRGKDTVDFLQGLVTSDVTLLRGDVTAQYSMMLNVQENAYKSPKEDVYSIDLKPLQGRVMYDLLLYHRPGQSKDEASVLVECDGSIQDEMVKLIRRYKIRKKVQIQVVTDEWQLFAAVKRSEDAELNTSSCVPDPRVPSFGWRILYPTDKPDMKWDNMSVEEESEYHKVRYQWGIPEGILDLPPGNCLPLESNLIFHNGVSFLKGCYIGQELTARTHHTGVTRKRVMPLVFEKDVDELIEPGINITREDGKNVGKYRHCVGKNGLGLMRIGDLKGQLTVPSRDGSVLPLSARIPSWWPQDAT